LLNCLSLSHLFIPVQFICMCVCLSILLFFVWSISDGIIGSIDLLFQSGERLNSEQLENLHVIKHSGESLLVLINDILDLSKVEAGKLDLVEEQIVLRDCIESSLDVVANAAFDKGLEIIPPIGLNLPNVIFGDESRLRQILVNRTRSLTHWHAHTHTHTHEPCWSIS